VAGWRAGGLPELTVAVNVSSRLLADERLIADVLAVLAETGLPPAALTLEIAEGAVMRDPVPVLHRLQALKTTGVRLAVDDFGSGASSMVQFARLPIDQLKLGRPFLGALTGDPRRLAILRSVLELTRTLDLEAVAVGVEDTTQLAVLAALPCPLAQGPLFAAPMAAADVPGFAARQNLFDAVR
jgi:EAL domain-containing protein (putative c-di-GMP-specific phosphodiesterase class I)